MFSKQEVIPKYILYLNVFILQEKSVNFINAKTNVKRAIVAVDLTVFRLVFMS